jgi:hypothetical protein
MVDDRSDDRPRDDEVRSHDQHPTDAVGDRVDVVEGPVGSAALRDPGRVAHGAADEEARRSPDEDPTANGS